MSAAADLVVDYKVDDVLDIEAAVSRRQEWRAGFDAGLLAGARRTLDAPALGQIAAELKLQRAAAESLGRQADHWRVKFLDALRRAIELARELDRRAPGWDRV